MTMLLFQILIHERVRRAICIHFLHKWYVVFYIFHVRYLQCHLSWKMLYKIMIFQLHYVHIHPKKQTSQTHCFRNTTTFIPKSNLNPFTNLIKALFTSMWDRNKRYVCKTPAKPTHEAYLILRGYAQLTSK